MAKRTLHIAIKRAYDEPAQEDGTRILVDRLWPRGLSKERALIDVWLKEIAPSDELRKWFAHDPEKFTEFRSRYKAELAAGEGIDALGRLYELARQGPITLLYAAHDTEHNNAVVLRDLFLAEK
ncbi:MAG TPA: DUF488 domain-containing protein [Ktedonobacteraceae bacterium]|nr:DUF488 domain-containing protein [Ktedonobacteraceae bacterium]